jgi:hypothetical protein
MVMIEGRSLAAPDIVNGADQTGVVRSYDVRYFHRVVEIGRDAPSNLAGSHSKSSA